MPDSPHHKCFGGLINLAIELVDLLFELSTYILNIVLELNLGILELSSTWTSLNIVLELGT